MWAKYPKNWYERFHTKNREWEILCCMLTLSSKPKILSFHVVVTQTTPNIWAKIRAARVALCTYWLSGRTGREIFGPRHGIRTERSEVRAPWPRANYLPVRPDLTQSISILSYDHRAFPFFFLFPGNKIQNVHWRRSFWPKSRDLYSNCNKVVLVRISPALSLQNYWENPRMRAVRDPSRAGRLFPAPLVPLRTALIRGFSQ